DDFGVLAPHLAGLDGVRLVIDSALGRGELRLHSDSVRIDGTIGSRLQTVLEATLASSGERPRATSPPPTGRRRATCAWPRACRPRGPTRRRWRWPAKACCGARSG